ncbi:MAG: EAL domain-containing protein [Gluconacetobacter diazotrophicus]|nr:EAL domain-containing protein [Gluconacetobacter diazotrophicus]
MPIIAILDDRLTNRSIYERLAQSLEADSVVHPFADPLHALEWLAGNPADLVITDFRMPGLDGAAFTRALRAQPGCADIPVIVITAYDDRSYRLQALEAGATDFLRSPIDHAEFLTRGRNLLRLYRQHRLIEGRARFLERELANSERSREKLLRDSREALAQVIDTVPAFISATDTEGRLVFVNAAHAGREPSATADGEPLQPGPLFGPGYEQRSRALDQLVFASGKPLPEFEQEVTDRDGQPRILLTTKSPLRDAGGGIQAVLTTSLDITDRKRAERRLQHVASHDGLTDLPNRALLRERIQFRLARGNRGSGMLAVHYLDLGGFKEINDQLGHHFGDTVLRTVADRLLQCVGPHDTVARLGGDEFAILQTQIARPEQAEALAARMVEQLSRPVQHGDHDVSVGASIGIAIGPTVGNDPEELLRHADIAMYRAKTAGGSRVRVFMPDMTQRAGRNLRLEQELRRALREEELVLYYQPQVAARTHRITGFEALLRWDHPTRGLLPPSEFLPAAEQRGLSGELDDWILRRACADALRWQGMHPTPVGVGVNLSPVRIGTEEMRHLVTTVLEETGLDPRLLELELTEGELVEDLPSAAGVLADLRALGVRVAIDDFGVGYSSLSYVRDFPVDRLKIDQSFVRNLRGHGSDATIVRSIIHLAHGLGLTVVAEGVETVEQLVHLAGDGCDEIQGYYFGRPVPFAAVPDLLRARDA